MMKHTIFYLFLALTVFSCSEDSSSEKMMNPMANDGQGGSLATFALKGDYLYVVDNNRLNVFDISEEGNPVEVSSVMVGFQIETLFSHKDYLYIGSRNGMFIYSLDDPEQPVELSSVNHFTACDPVVANDSLAFVTLHSNTNCGNGVNLLEIYDVTNVTQPQLITSKQLAMPKGLGLYGNYLFVCDNTIKVFDVSSPATSLNMVSSINNTAFDVIIRNNLLIAIGKSGLYQYELRNDSTNLAIEELSSIQI